MNVLIHTVIVHLWAIVIDDMHDIANVQPTSRHASGNQDRRSTTLEGTPGESQLCGAEVGEKMTYRASSRSRWVRSEWIEVQGKPRLKRKSSTKSAVFLDLTKTRV